MHEKLLRAARVSLGTALNAALDWFYPRHCCHCGEPIDAPDAAILCRRCYGDLVSTRLSGDLCRTCGQPLAGSEQARQQCLTCRLERRYFDAARAFFAYRAPGSSVIKSFKFGGDFHLGPRFLEGLLQVGWLPEDIRTPEAVVPVPLHRRRRRQRGYDQALLLGRVLAEHFGAPLLGRALRRTRHTDQQAQLPLTRRWDNVRGAFRVSDPGPVEGASLLLVDDVMTTGMTADECARVLKGAGAERVQVLTLARTAP